MNLQEQFILETVTSLRAEIVMANWRIMASTLTVLIIMCAIHVVAHLPGVDQRVILLNLFLPIGLGFWAAHDDFVMHRAGAYVRQQEQKILAPKQGWENSEARRFKNWVILVTDLGSLIPILYLFYFAAAFSWHEGFAKFTVLCATLFLVSLATIFYAGTVFRQLK